MRIDIRTSKHRNFFLRTLMNLADKYFGKAPEPMLFISYDPKQIPKPMINYMMRGTSSKGAFNKGESELFAAFISTLNSCSF